MMNNVIAVTQRNGMQLPVLRKAESLPSVRPWCGLQMDGTTVGQLVAFYGVDAIWAATLLHNYTAHFYAGPDHFISWYLRCQRMLIHTCGIVMPYPHEVFPGMREMDDETLDAFKHHPAWGSKS